MTTSSGHRKIPLTVQVSSLSACAMRRTVRVAMMRQDGVVMTRSGVEDFHVAGGGLSQSWARAASDAQHSVLTTGANDSLDSRPEGGRGRHENEQRGEPDLACADLVRGRTVVPIGARHGES